MNIETLNVTLDDIDRISYDVGYHLSVYELPPEGVDVEELTESTLEEGQGFEVEPNEFIVLSKLESEKIPKEIDIHTSCTPWDHEINDAYAKSGYILEVEITFELVDTWTSEQDIYAKYKLTRCHDV